MANCWLAVNDTGDGSGIVWFEKKSGAVHGPASTFASSGIPVIGLTPSIVIETVLLAHDSPGNLSAESVPVAPTVTVWLTRWSLSIINALLAPAPKFC